MTQSLVAESVSISAPDRSSFDIKALFRSYSFLFELHYYHQAFASNYKNTVKKTDSEKDSKNTKDGNVTTSTVELKTSRPGDKNRAD